MELLAVKTEAGGAELHRHSVPGGHGQCHSAAAWIQTGSSLMFGGKITTAVSDQGLRRLLTWVFTALIVTVLFAMLVVELTLRWFR